MFVQAKLKGQSMENKKIEVATNIDCIMDIENSLSQRILSKESIEKDFEQKSSTYLVCYINDIPIGYITYLNCIDHIDIISVAVKPEYRRKGIATELFNYLDKINSQKLKLFLEVREHNLDAINLYTNLGFKHIYTRQNYYSSPSENALVYEK